MARRRKLQAPSAEDLTRLEEEFRRETPMKGAMAPIAQVAADAAGQSPVVDAAAREKLAKDSADADRLRDAESKGLVMTEVPLDQIDMNDMIRDRASVDQVELSELIDSISANSLRLPVELYRLKQPGDGKTYGVVSGYRRLLALKHLHDQTGESKFATAKSLIKPIESVPEAFVAMVEENEIRSQLSHFERGRIAVVSTQNGAFETVEDAVRKLFASASKSKRSKVRSFAHVFEELGDLLGFADQLTEKQGLRLASTLRMGHTQELREAMASRQPANSEEEWLCLLPVVESAEEGPKDQSRGGRPKSASRPKPGTGRLKSLCAGEPVVLSRDEDEQGILLRFQGKGASKELVDAAIDELRALLGN
ncbi:ParB/RepB/Spo0J family partition protein [Aliiroseovarius sp. KMU-50]|uniref:ParB/RepB/Spo0J family partition protein n=1 Tax=Aliiroseovarius salicola TaxID=3009082 RepID=A0ABT4W5U0_9RHOB|nr:ParB/RepB/Spo0J family partition protein [Aliiroseovarius sp. KMU-50]MDA5095350.1 ParB/RepB/Spo0J family partition protein [Aliiroseovarius sp. KMU-50]